MTRNTPLTLACLLLSALLMAPIAAAGTDSTGDTDSDMDMTDSGDDGATPAPHFLDRALLLDTVLSDDPSAADAMQDIADAQMALDDATSAGAAQEELDALAATLMSAQDDLAALEMERSAVESLVGELSDAQVIALNRFLNNTRHNGLVIDLDSDALAAIRDGDYNGHQIRALTLELEAIARAERRAARFQARFDATGRERFLAHADRALAQGASQAEHFNSQIDPFAENPSEQDDMDAGNDAAAELRRTARRDARELARASGRDAAHARRAARDAARDASQVAAGAAQGLN